MIRDPDVPWIPVVPDVHGVPDVPCDLGNCGDPENCGDPVNCDGPDPYDVMKIYCFPGILIHEFLFEVARPAAFSALLDISTKLVGEAGD